MLLISKSAMYCICVQFDDADSKSSCCIGRKQFHKIRILWRHPETGDDVEMIDNPKYFGFVKEVVKYGAQGIIRVMYRGPDLMFGILGPESSVKSWRIRKSTRTHRSILVATRCHRCRIKSISTNTDPKMLDAGLWATCMPFATEFELGDLTRYTL